MDTNAANNGEFGQRPEPPTPIVPKTASEALRPEAGTPPPPSGKRSRASRSQIVVFMNFVVSCVMLLVLAAGVALYLGKQAFVGPGPSEGATFLVKPNSGVAEIADQLERRGLVSDARIFRLGVRAYGNEQALKAGEYEIKPHASMREIMELLKSGKSVMYSLTIPEGLTVEQAFQRIAEQEELTGDMPARMPPEGSLATDTLRFTRGATRAQMVEKLLADQRKLVEDIWSHRSTDLPLANVDEFVTLASIVEKETGKNDERSRVAAVFLNRLAKGMRLQSDPTIIYGLFGGKGKPAAGCGRAACDKEAAIVRELMRTNDMVLVSAVGALLDGAAEGAFGSVRFEPPVTALIDGSISFGSTGLLGRSAARFETVLLSSMTMPTTLSFERSIARRWLDPSFQSTVVASIPFDASAPCTRPCALSWAFSLLTASRYALPIGPPSASGTSSYIFQRRSLMKKKKRFFPWRWIHISASLFL